MRDISKKLAKLGRYKWTIHNVVAHPLSEVFHLLGYSQLGNKIHDITIPEHVRGQGRG